MKKTLLFCGLFFLLTICVNAQRVASEKAISVKAGGFESFRYDLTQTARIWGKFRATGGKNDIECYIVDEDNFENLKNGNQFRRYYESGRVTVATFDVTLNQGVYYLVFNNSWSVMTPKAVTIQFYGN
jgi:hypothetical protein